MISSELKMMVAQNCSSYEGKSAIFMSSLGSLSESCSNCSNYIREKCSKNLFDEIKETIQIN